MIVKSHPAHIKDIYRLLINQRRINMPGFGIPELIVILIAIILYGIPIAAGIWAIVPLHRIPSGQKIILNRLDGIERAVHNSLLQQ